MFRWFGPRSDRRSTHEDVDLHAIITQVEEDLDDLDDPQMAAQMRSDLAGLRLGLAADGSSDSERSTSQGDKLYQSLFVEEEESVRALAATKIQRRLRQKNAVSRSRLKRETTHGQELVATNRSFDELREHPGRDTTRQPSAVGVGGTRVPQHQHPLVAAPRELHVCDLCADLGTAYRCASGCDWDMCLACFSKTNDVSEVACSTIGAATSAAVAAEPAGMTAALLGSGHSSEPSVPNGALKLAQRLHASMPFSLATCLVAVTESGSDWSKSSRAVRLRMAAQWLFEHGEAHEASELQQQRQQEEAERREADEAARAEERRLREAEEARRRDERRKRQEVQAAEREAAEREAREVAEREEAEREAARMEAMRMEAARREAEAIGRRPNIYAPSLPPNQELPTALAVLTASRELAHERTAREERRAFASLADSADPFWLNKAFVGEFCDAFIADTSLEGGSPNASIETLVATARLAIDRFRAALGLLSDRHLRHVDTALRKLTDAALVDPTDPRAGWPVDFVRQRCEDVRRLKVGDFMIWPLGWRTPDGGHAIMLLVERLEKSSCALVVCNTGEGVEHHPTTAEGYPKEKRKTAMRVRSPHRAQERLCRAAPPHCPPLTAGACRRAFFAGGSSTGADGGSCGAVRPLPSACLPLHRARCRGLL